ncbi:MAG: hypothetical protein IJD33_00660, partial [Clostridia bacterium]|nr:hypothetical protein [Clostridia bacterium]
FDKDTFIEEYSLSNDKEAKDYYSTSYNFVEGYYSTVKRPYSEDVPYALSVWMSELEDITTLSFDYNMLATSKFTCIDLVEESVRVNTGSTAFPTYENVSIYHYTPVRVSDLSFEGIQSYLFAESNSFTYDACAMYTLRLRLGTQTGAQEFYSLLALERFVNTSTVAGIELSSSSMVF